MTVSRMLIAVNDSRGAMKAVEYAGQCLFLGKNAEVMLVHVLPNLPTIFWDEGHILSVDEKIERHKVVSKWLADRQTAMEPVFQKAMAILAAYGVKEDAVVRKTISDSLDVADSIIEEAKESLAGTIVLGRHGRPEVGRHLIGAVANKIVHHAAGLTVIIVD